MFMSEYYCNVVIKFGKSSYCFKMKMFLQELHSRELHHLKHSCAGIPSALPFVDTLSEIEQVDEHNSTVRAQSRPFPANSSDSETTNFPKTSRSTHAVNPPEDSTRYEIHDLSIGLCFHTCVYLLDFFRRTSWML